jgi:hypothetical protein
MLNKTVVYGKVIAGVFVSVGFVVWHVMDVTSEINLHDKLANGQISESSYCDELDRHGWMTLSEEVRCRALYQYQLYGK